jgi:hypothetical protein
MFRKSIALAALTAVAAAGAAGAAEAPVVSEQGFIAGKAPVTVPGTGVKQGTWMGSKQRLIYRDVTLEGDQRARVTLTAQKGKRIRGLAVAEGEKIAFKVTDRDYAGKRSVTVVASIAGGAGDEERTGRILALQR